MTFPESGLIFPVFKDSVSSAADPTRLLPITFRDKGFPALAALFCLPLNRWKD